MVMNATAYLTQLQALLPRGAAWTRDPEAVLTKLLQALAAEFARIDTRAGNLLLECDPRLTTELLPDWERVAGLPDACVGQPETLTDRRAALHARITAAGGQSATYFISLAATLGYAITVTEFRPYTCQSPCEDNIYDHDWAFTWRVNAPETTIREFTCESSCMEPLRSWGNLLLECTIARNAPAHANLLFGYEPDG